MSQGVVRAETGGVRPDHGGFLQPRKESSLRCCKQWSDMVRCEFQAAHNMFEGTRPDRGDKRRVRAEAGLGS